MEKTKIIVEKRLAYTGITQADFARSVDITPVMLNAFLKGKSAINSKSLEKMFERLGVNLSVFSSRFDFANELAETLMKKNIKPEEVPKMSQSDLMKLTGRKEVKLFTDVSEKEFELAISSPFLDPEATLPFLKTIIIFSMGIKKTGTGKVSSTTVNQTWKSILRLAPFGLVGATIMPSMLVGAIAGSLFGKAIGGLIALKAMQNDKNLEGNLLASFYEVAKHNFKK